MASSICGATNGKATPQHSPQFRADHRVPIPPANKVGARRRPHFAQTCRSPSNTKSGNQSKTYADLERRPCCVEENGMSYHIEINEYQRRLIMKALTSTDVNQFSQAPGSGDAFDTEAK